MVGGGIVTDEKVNQLRRELRTLVTSSYVRVIAAASLLEHKAKTSPNTAEGKAHSLLLEAQGAIEKWLGGAGGDVLEARASLRPAIAAALASNGEAPPVPAPVPPPVLGGAGR
jgi:hypothetical protein